jgi:hypothetical protein
MPGVRANFRMAASILSNTPSAALRFSAAK